MKNLKAPKPLPGLKKENTSVESSVQDAKTDGTREKSLERIGNDA